MSRVLIEIEHLKALKDIAEMFAGTVVDERQEQLHAAIFVADVQIQGIEQREEAA